VLVRRENSRLTEIYQTVGRGLGDLSEEAGVLPGLDVRIALLPDLVLAAPLDVRLEVVLDLLLRAADRHEARLAVEAEQNVVTLTLAQTDVGIALRAVAPLADEVELDDSPALTGVAGEMDLVLGPQNLAGLVAVDTAAAGDRIAVIGAAGRGARRGRRGRRLLTTGLIEETHGTQFVDRLAIRLVVCVLVGQPPAPVRVHVGLATCIRELEVVMRRQPHVIDHTAIDVLAVDLRVAVLASRSELDLDIHPGTGDVEAGRVAGALRPGEAGKEHGSDDERGQGQDELTHDSLSSSGLVGGKQFPALNDVRRPTRRRIGLAHARRVLAEFVELIELGESLCLTLLGVVPHCTARLGSQLALLSGAVHRRCRRRSGSAAVGHHAESFELIDRDGQLGFACLLLPQDLAIFSFRRVVTTRGLAEEVLTPRIAKGDDLTAVKVKHELPLELALCAPHRHIVSGVAADRPVALFGLERGGSGLALRLGVDGLGGEAQVDRDSIARHLHRLVAGEREQKSCEGDQKDPLHL